MQTETEIGTGNIQRYERKTKAIKVENKKINKLQLEKNLWQFSKKTRNFAKNVEKIIITAGNLCRLEILKNVTKKGVEKCLWSKDNRYIKGGEEHLNNNIGI